MTHGEGLKPQNRILQHTEVTVFIATPKDILFQTYSRKEEDNIDMHMPACWRSWQVQICPNKSDTDISVFTDHLFGFSK